MAGKDYETISSVLAQVGALPGAAESDGILCGLACASTQLQAAAWIEQVLADTEQSEQSLLACEQVLTEHFQQFFLDLNSEDLRFRPLLPADREPLQERAQALAKWCQGFLFGLGLGGIQISGNGSSEVEEVLQDISEISKVELHVEDGSEEDEFDFVEIVEYVRVGVLLIYEELHPAEIPGPLQ